MVSKLKKGITIAELIGIFAMLGVLCAAVTPHLVEFREANRLSKLRFNLERLRQRIDDYRQRTGHPPKELKDAFPDAIEPIFENPLSNGSPGSRNRVKVIQAVPPSVEQVTRSGLGGWLYDPETGGVWADSESFLDE